MSAYTLYTNVVSAPLRDRGEVAAKLTEATAKGDGVTLTAISYFEARRWLVLPHLVGKLRAFERFARIYGVLPLTRSTLDLAADIYQELRRQGELIEDADILIAATALAHDATLITRNLKHFERIEGLRLESLFLKPWEA